MYNNICRPRHITAKLRILSNAWGKIVKNGGFNGSLLFAKAFNTILITTNSNIAYVPTILKDFVDVFVKYITIK